MASTFPGSSSGTVSYATVTWTPWTSTQPASAKKKKQLTFGAHKTLSEADAILKLRRWVVAGLDISCDGDFCRQCHVKRVDARKLTEPSLAECEQRVLAWFADHPEEAL